MYCGQAAAERGGLPVEQGAQDSWRMLLVVQQEEPAFVVARVDGPAQTVTLCALPGNLQVAAPAGTTTLADCALSAGGRAGGPAAEPDHCHWGDGGGELYYLAATPACWQDCVGATATARLDTAALLSKEQRTEIGYGEDSVAELRSARLFATLQGALDTAGKQADVRAAVWEAFVRQNPDLLAAMPEAWRQYSARTLTDLMATELGGLEKTLDYLTAQPGLTVQYTTAETRRAGRETALTEAGMKTVRELLQ